MGWLSDLLVGKNPTPTPARTKTPEVNAFKLKTLITAGFTNLHVIDEDGNKRLVLGLNTTTFPRGSDLQVLVRSPTLSEVLGLTNYDLTAETEELFNRYTEAELPLLDSRVTELSKLGTSWFPTALGVPTLSQLTMLDVGIEVIMLPSNTPAILYAIDHGGADYGLYTTFDCTLVLRTPEGYIPHPVLNVEFKFKDDFNSVRERIDRLYSDQRFTSNENTILTKAYSDFNPRKGQFIGKLIKLRTESRARLKRVVVAETETPLGKEVLVMSARGEIPVVEKDFIYNYEVVGHIDDLSNERRYDDLEGLTLKEWKEKYFVAKPVTE